MKVLVLGGTLFLGRHLVEAALARGDEVTVFNRGRTNPDLFPEVERLHGDRDAGDLGALRGREWDAIVDPSARVPRWVRDTARLAADTGAHYTFVSSVSVYRDLSAPGVREEAPVHTLEDETVEEIVDSETYGALKALCERALEEELPGRGLAVRAGLIVGPYDNTGRFTYWVHRIARGGDVLAPEPRDQPVQFVHARDLADWIFLSAERRLAGVFNATGPDALLTLEELLKACGELAESHVTLRWLDERFLVEQGVQEWSDLPLWVAPGVKEENAGLMSVDVSRALAEGLRFRPLRTTVHDTLAAAEPTTDAGLTPEREQALLAA
ncbi:MAG TPA: SDR family oxidoreductase [Gaiellaceae bacterium]|nr:SDR family oxidoreductase [Gaiellaceae bacterium]